MRRPSSTRAALVALLWAPLAALTSPPRAAAVITPVHVDQFGYTPTDTKWVAVGAPAATFEVRRTNDGVSVFSGPLSLRRLDDPASGDDVYSGTFTALATPGSYFVRVPGVGDSPTFLIHGAVYDDLYRYFLKGLYYQRCGTAIPAAFGGAWTHGACHDHGGSIASYDWSTTGGAPGGYRNTIGGWHDAGDYGKYVTNNSYAVGILLQAYLLYPAKYAHDDCDIPESGNGVPDLLDEARWSITWMLTMQDADGSVRHRESIANYAGEHLPESEPTTRYYTSISSDATAVHCAAMALAARAYRATDPAFAVSCSTSAARAWTWLQAHPARVPAGGFVNQFGHTGATYISANETGRRIWAAAEMFRLAGLASAKSFFDANWGESLTFNGVFYPDSWGALENMGAFAYRDAPGATPSIVSGSWWSIVNSTLSSSANWNTRQGQDGYACVASATPPYGDYYWGFTGVILRYAWTMLEGFRYSGTVAYQNAAREQLHYILGRNPMGKVYMTGVGDRPVLHAHGAWNLAAGYVAIDDSLCHPTPYSLIGGPNKADNSSLSIYPGRCYEDIADPNYFFKGNYTLNETSVNIQASLIVLAGYFSAGLTASDVPPSPDQGGAAVASAAFPNPFRESATFRWSPLGALAAPGLAAASASLSGERAVLVFDATGRLVARVDGAIAGAGGSALEARWDGRRIDGTLAPSGVYFYRLPDAAATTGRVVRLR